LDVLGEMSLGETLLGEMSLGEMSLGETSLGETTSYHLVTLSESQVIHHTAAAGKLQSQNVRAGFTRASSASETAKAG
jgi:hypothetical protein